MKTIPALLSLTLLLNASRLFAEDSPEAIVQAYCEALKTNDLFGVSGFMHPDSLEEFKAVWHTFIVEHYDEPIVAPMLQTYTHGEPRRSVGAYSARKVFERFLETAFRLSPVTQQVLQGIDFKIVKSEVVAGTALIDVEYTFEFNGQQRTRTDKLRLRKDGLEWRLLVSPDLNEIAEKLSQLPRS